METKIFKCMHCKSSFVEELKLKYHIEEKHKKNVTCNICGLYMENKKHFARHMSEHKKEKKIKCKECNELFTRTSNLKRHALKHKNKKISCPICKRDYSRMDALKRHIKSCKNYNLIICISNNFFLFLIYNRFVLLFTGK